MVIFLFSTLYAYSPAIRVKVKEIIEPADKVYTIATAGRQVMRLRIRFPPSSWPPR